jgi:AraC-like DNA-binding protein
LLSTTYEQHSFLDPDFPIIFHLNNLNLGNNFLVHWHENIEILNFRHGNAVVYRDAVPINLSEGEIIVVNSGAIHSIHSTSSNCSYDCLIVDRNFLVNLGFPLDEVHLTNIVNDTISRNYFDQIKDEIEKKSPYYKIAIKSSILGLFARLYRISDKHSVSAKQTASKSLEMVRSAISYIRQNYRNDLTIDDICSYVGFSKYYFCHEFKKITGRTVMDTINFLRCSHAHRLLATGLYNVTESAERSGFHNLSYFSKMYKRYMGVLPSETYDQSNPE